MEDNIGTIFYIVLVVIVLIISTVARNRKKKAAAQMPQKGETEGFDPFQLFEQDSREPDTEMSDQMTITAPETPQVQSELETIIEEGVSAFDEGSPFDEGIDSIYQEEMITDDQEHQPSEDLTQQYKAGKEESELDKIMDEFDLKKAVILSEILNRKEF